MTNEQRSNVISATKQTIPAVAKGTRDDESTRGAILSALVMARELGFKKAEVMVLVQEEWLHLTEIDNKTVKGAIK